MVKRDLGHRVCLSVVPGDGKGDQSAEHPSAKWVNYAPHRTGRDVIPRKTHPRLWQGCSRRVAVREVPRIVVEEQCRLPPRGPPSARAEVVSSTECEVGLLGAIDVVILRVVKDGGVPVRCTDGHTETRTFRK